MPLNPTATQRTAGAISIGANANPSPHAANTAAAR